MQINPYLIFDGRCEAAFRFYEQVLGGKIAAMMTFADTPMAEHTPPETHDKIVHARLIVGDTVLMGSDDTAGHSEKMNGFSVTLNIDQSAKAERVFEALAAPRWSVGWSSGGRRVLTAGKIAAIACHSRRALDNAAR